MPDNGSLSVGDKNTSLNDAQPEMVSEGVAAGFYDASTHAKFTVDRAAPNSCS